MRAGGKRSGAELGGKGVEAVATVRSAAVLSWVEAWCCRASGELARSFKERRSPSARRRRAGVVHSFIRLRTFPAVNLTKRRQTP